MADENKNQESDENKKSSSDDDFGLPDFEFDALEDDDDEIAEADPVVEDPTPEKPAEESPKPASSDEEVPSMDADDFEDMDLEGIEDVDLGEIDDLGDLGDLDLEDLDLDDLDLGDLDKELDSIDATISDTSEDEKAPVPVSADKIEDIFSEPTPKEESSSEESVGEIEDDGLFYEEEAFEDFDIGDDESSDTPTPSSEDSTDSGFDLGGDNADGMFDDGDDVPDVSFDDSEESVPFADRPVEGAEGLSEKELNDEYGEVLVDEDNSGARSKFVRIVVLGVVLFVSIGFGFLYLNETIGFGGDETAEVAKKTTEKAPPKQTDTNLKKQAAKEETTKKAETKTTQKAPKKTATKKPVPAKTTTPAAGITTLTARTGKSYIVVGSFVDSGSAAKYANKMVSQGQSPTIIPPFGKATNYRVAVASFASFSAAEQKLSDYRQQLGSSVWVLRY